MWRSRQLAWRRNRWMIAALAAFSALMLWIMGNDDVVPYTVSQELASQTRADAANKAAARGPVGVDVTNPVDVFDIGVVHTVNITMAPAEYDALVTDYQRDGLKTWHPATVEIDGVTVENVGVRLKGNSTIVGLRYSGPESPPPPPSAAIFGTITKDEPQKLSFLLRFDYYVPGQRYQGVNEIALRSAGAIGDSTQLTDLVANLLTAESGQPYLRASTSGITLNGSPEGFVMLIEHPDDYWADRMIPGTAEPALYKATPGASFHYLGEDPDKYAGVFNQQSETRSIGPGPMIDFLRFVDTASDEQFAAGLEERLDVKEFAQYLAFHNLIVDPDSFAGTGNNYYFLYDPTSGLMRIAPWDQNIAFGLLGGSRYRPYYEDGAALPEFARNFDDVDELNDGGTGLGEENILMRRFFDTPKFLELYQETYRELFAALFTSGRVAALMDEITPAIRDGAAERGLVPASAFDGNVSGKKRFIEARIEYLQSHEIITGSAAPETTAP